ncbi:MAG: cobalamin transport system ATP-binding protein, partial [Chloroflexota bacterium]|nr:cobalamin transport system ATP-binding protein [Chloroflexota bacterium]
MAVVLEQPATDLDSPAIRAERLSFVVGGARVVADVSLDVRAGEVLGVIGPNGAGKSTLLRLLAALLRPTAGAVLLDGAPAHSLPRRAIAQRIAVVTQQATIDFDLTALELVLMGRHPHLGRFQMEGRTDVGIAREALATVGAAAFADRTVVSLSGGERQLVTIARALAQQPQTLILDEPTASLDIVHQLRIADLLWRLAHVRGLAVVVALHDLALAARAADRLALLSGGRLVAEGAPLEVLDEKRVQAVFGVSLEDAGVRPAGSLANASDPEGTSASWPGTAPSSNPSPRFGGGELSGPLALPPSESGRGGAVATRMTTPPSRAGSFDRARPEP